MRRFSSHLKESRKMQKGRTVSQSRLLPCLISLLALLSVAAGPPVQRDGSRSPLRLYPHQVSSIRQAAQWPVVQAQSALVADVDTNQVLMAKQADVPRPMASTTKIMTALLALERGDLDRGQPCPRQPWPWAAARCTCRPAKPHGRRPAVWAAVGFGQ
ncbi:MAG: D-alanyl-D-alanine carboxypeptidase [Anaerolineae bacterium]|uniref:D-alanyl-D-alanine carboxypeptidase n=1 Tax=Candidatus Amarolinea dominans TaxID=3140696 RepID=UPI003136ACF1|nr:D-alanyl-D-alanine carboxypeptidase [Anaerolineae bacterium]